MISNRQGGRRRGRGSRSQGSPNQGNRQDNRQRGNAAQLLEKYKSLARDAQTQGDRVQSEYFLQFADHYFRVLAENRARIEEQRRQRGERGADNDGGRRERVAQNDDDRESQGEQKQRRPRKRQAAEDVNGARKDRDVGGKEKIAVDSLPPAIAPDKDAEEEKPQRRPRKRSGDEASPAA
ncbi:MAG: DUF4167 domain-containing protein [Sphingomonadaceae bacterium]